MTLSAEEVETLIARVHQSNLARVDAGMVEQIIRMYGWVAFALFTTVHIFSAKW